MAYGKFRIYLDAGGKPDVGVEFDENGAFWKTQAEIAEIFGTDVDTIGLDIQNIFKDGEMDKNKTTTELPVVQNLEGVDVTQSITHYNLDVILAVGLRVNSTKGNLFRNWSTGQLKKHDVMGFLMGHEKISGDRRKE